MVARLMPWPPMPDVIKQQLELIRMEGEEDDEAEGVVQPPPDADPETGEVLEHRIRPWDLTRLHGELESAVWSWLDDVVLWLNNGYGWQEEQIIPACWPLHEGMAHDLAALAFGRPDAYATDTPAFVGRWHSDWEDFQRRMQTALGSTAGRECRAGDHRRPSTYTVTSVLKEINRGRRKAEASAE
ncbi:hypothetical protein [Streptomyces chrestomyceticus]|uniref:hypothetical protein n=1 Tax=Streptomyces chrestomyceticus TaxID=68185 RepID=UPI003402C280